MSASLVATLTPTRLERGGCRKEFQVNQAGREQDQGFDDMLQHVIAKLQANRNEVLKAKRTRLTVHRATSGKISVELETKL